MWCGETESGDGRLFEDGCGETESGDGRLFEDGCGETENGGEDRLVVATFMEL